MHELILSEFKCYIDIFLLEKTDTFQTFMDELL